jgi:hypothetical protein
VEENPVSGVFNILPSDAIGSDTDSEQTGIATDNAMKLPHCVSFKSWQAWCKNRDWLIVDDHKVKCRVCTQVLREGLGTLKRLAGPKCKLSLGFAKGVTTDHIKVSKKTCRNEKKEVVEKNL